MAEHGLGQPGARCWENSAGQGNRVFDLKELTVREQVNNRQGTRLPEVVRTVATVNQNDLAARDEVGEYETG